MSLILEAATQVMGRVGYERMTTNAIAAEAGISPGSLYQYFSSKEDIASALWERYATELRAILDDEALTSQQTSVAELVDRVADPVHALKTAHKAFAQLYSRAADDQGLESVRRAHEAFDAGLVDIMAARNPSWHRAELEVVAAIVSGMFATTITRDSLTGDPATDLTEVKKAIVAYLVAKGIS